MSFQMRRLLKKEKIKSVTMNYLSIIKLYIIGNFCFIDFILNFIIQKFHKGVRYMNFKSIDSLQPIVNVVNEARMANAVTWLLFIEIFAII